MSKKGRNRPRPLTASSERLIPLSPGTAEKGLEVVFGTNGDDKESLRAALLRYNRNQQAAQFIASMGMLRLGLKFMPSWESSGTFANSNQLLVALGAATYLTCLDQEALQRKLAVPNIELADRTYYMEKRLGFKPRPSAIMSPSEIETRTPLLAKNIVDEAAAFDMIETEFCTQLLVGMRPESGYSNKERHDQIIGASMLYHLYDARYERLEQLATAKS